MLAYLDTVIAFAVVMLGISLLITILNQAVSALLAHRGSNLRWGLTVLFKNIDPTNFPNLTPNAKAVAEAVLTHHLISDSVFSTDGMSKLVRRWRLASAIRPEELVAILTHITANRPPAISAAVAGEITNLLAASSPSAIRQTDQIAAAAKALPTDLVPKTFDTVQASAGNLEAWFRSIQDRVKQRFTMWIRMWTVLFSFVIAGLFCIDAFHLVSDLYKRGDFRNQVIGLGDQVKDIVKNTSQTPQQAQKQDVQKLATILTSSGFPQFGLQNWCDNERNQAPTWQKILGVLTSALLLSLGAPFWFNTLNSLTSLRPSLAAKQKSEEQAKQTSK